MICSQEMGELATNTQITNTTTGVAVADGVVAPLPAAGLPAVEADPGVGVLQNDAVNLTAGSNIFIVRHIYFSVLLLLRPNAPPSFFFFFFFSFFVVSLFHRGGRGRGRGGSRSYRGGGKGGRGRPSLDNREPQQEQLKSYKDFLLSQPDDITPDVAQKAYDVYRKEYHFKHARKFLETHQEEVKKYFHYNNSLLQNTVLLYVLTGLASGEI